MSNIESRCGRDIDARRVTRRKVLQSSTASAVPFLFGGGTKVPETLAPEAMPQVLEPGTVSFTGVVISADSEDRMLSPVAAYRCPFCGARRIPPDVEDPSVVPSRLCPLCASDAPNEVDNRRRWLTFRLYGIDPTQVSSKPAVVESGEVLVPTEVINTDIEVYDRVRLTGQQREIASILPEMYSPEETLTELKGPVGKAGKKLWHGTVQILSQSVTKLGTDHAV